MKIIVDADACPVKEIIIAVAKEEQLEVLMVCSLAHNIEEQTGVRVIQVDQEPQTADIAIFNQTQQSDIVVTQDYGLAAIAMGKGASAISPRGIIYMEERMDGMLTRRHIEQKYRRAGGRTKGPKPHTNQDDVKFENNLIRLIEEYKKLN